MHAIPEIHLLPPHRTELPNRIQAGALCLVGCLLGPYFVERLHAVVAPHRPGQVEARLDLQFAGIDRPASSEERLRAFRLVVGWNRVVGGGRLGAGRSLRTEPRRQVNLRVGPQRQSSPLGECLQPHEIDRALALGERLRRSVRERADSMQSQWALVSPQNCGDLIGNRLETVHPQKLGVARKARSCLGRQRLDAIEDQHANVLPQRPGGPWGERLEAREREESAVSGEQFDLTVGERLDAREPQVANVLPHEFRQLVADALQASKRETPRAGGGDQGTGGVPRQFGETIERQNSVWPRQQGS